MKGAEEALTKELLAKIEGPVRWITLNFHSIDYYEGEQALLNV